MFGCSPQDGESRDETQRFFRLENLSGGSSQQQSIRHLYFRHALFRTSQGLAMPRGRRPRFGALNQPVGCIGCVLGPGEAVEYCDTAELLLSPVKRQTVTVYHPKTSYKVFVTFFRPFVVCAGVVASPRVWLVVV
jgi:hypothetical protein